MFKSANPCCYVPFTQNMNEDGHTEANKQSSHEQDRGNVSQILRE